MRVAILFLLLLIVAGCTIKEEDKWRDAPRNYYRVHLKYSSIDEGSTLAKKIQKVIPQNSTLEWFYCNGWSCVSEELKGVDNEDKIKGNKK